MKKITNTLLTGAATLLVLGSVSAQSQRLIIAEEFTQASCGPCASQNPAFNALLEANKTKVVSIKYQTSWPGVDPMNAENPAEVQTRVDFYGVSGVPTAFLDGVGQKGASYDGAPANWTQAAIDAKYAVASPFTMTITHKFSSDYDSVYVDADITCSKDTSGDLVAHFAILEKEIIFTKAPGSNGEKEFYGVMRKMLPNAAGSALDATWTAGKTKHFSFGIAIPKYTRDMSQIAAIGFIQDKSTKAVHQATFSEPKAMAIGSKVSSVSTGDNVFQCSASVDPKIEMKNSGTTAITSCKVSYSIDNGTPSTYTWTGSLAAGAVTTISIPTLTVANGSHPFQANIVEINGNAYNSPANGGQGIMNVLTASTAMPFTEDFKSSLFPNNNTFINNPDNDDTWMRSTANSGSMRIMEYYAPAGSIDEFYLPLLDQTTIGTGAYLNFEIAHCGVTNNNAPDELQVWSSIDCGATWTSVASLDGANLFTAPATNSFYTPTKSHWRKISASLYRDEAPTNLLIKFVSVSGGGNYLYVDNINVAAAPTGIVPVSAKAAEVMGNAYPNPATGIASIEVNNLSAPGVITLTDVTGKTVLSQAVEMGSSKVTLDLKNVESGMYFYNLVSGSNIISAKKLNVIK